MKPFYHILIILCYGMAAGGIGMFTVSAPHAGLATLPLITGLGAFCLAGLVHLAWQYWTIEKRHQRHMLVLTRAINQLSYKIDGEEKDRDISAGRALAKNKRAKERRLVEEAEDEEDIEIAPPKPRLAKPDIHNDEIEDEIEQAPIKKRANVAIPPDEQEGGNSPRQEPIEPDQRTNGSDIKKLRSLINQIYSKEEGKGERGNSEPMARKIPNPPRLLRELNDHQILEKTIDALEENRIIMYMQPVVSLPNREVQYQECFSKLYDEHGMEIGPERFMSVVSEAGLLPSLDQKLVFSLLDYLKKISHNQQNIRFFCNLSASTISDPAFFKAFLERLEATPGIIARLIMEIPQTHLEQGDAELLQAIKMLRSVGFKLSLDQVHHVENALELALRLGFSFMKMRAPMLMVYLDGLSQGKGGYANQQLGEWRANGLEIIAERLESEEALKELLEYDITLGQGYLFGQPKAHK